MTDHPSSDETFNEWKVEGGATFLFPKALTRAEAVDWIEERHPGRPAALLCAGQCPVTDRPSLDETLMSVATAWSLRSTCQRLQVGAVLARDGRTISTGYNGAPSGEDGCGCQTWVGTHEISNDSLLRPAKNAMASVRVNKGARCERAVHAELNCLLFAARHGVSSLGATMYCTDSPCSTPSARGWLTAATARLGLAGSSSTVSTWATVFGEGRFCFGDPRRRRADTPCAMWNGAASAGAHPMDHTSTCNWNPLHSPSRP